MSETLNEVQKSIGVLSKEYPDHNSSGYLALKALSKRLKSEYDRNFKERVLFWILTLTILICSKIPNNDF